MIVSKDSVDYDVMECLKASKISVTLASDHKQGALLQFL